MLFNSYVFILLFLPIVLIVFYKIGSIGHHRVALAWLVGASLFFYGWWNPVYLGLIIGSMLFNYAIGLRLSSRNNGSDSSRKLLLIFGIVMNLSLIVYFKYANFFIDNVNYVLNGSIEMQKLMLPLAISFFTFQQITYLVDAYKGETKEYNFLHYCLFVTFFPQLIAGPIVHHREMLPQFIKDSIYKFKADNLSIGLTIFFIGLFKKVVLADSVAIYATPVFNAAEAGELLTFVNAWCGALSYTFQLYFDFSGYSDMAIGLARMFGILLPLNFHSPYKAVNISDFWRRWHMTLSRFLRDYVYIPLGGNRHGTFKKYNNLIITMLLGGLWHGAGWTFVIWGGLHGLYLVIGSAWEYFKYNVLGLNSNSSLLGRVVGRVITFVAVVVGWVFFRAESLDSALLMLNAMSGANGIVFPEIYLGHLNSLNGAGSALIEYGVSFSSLPYFFGVKEIYLLFFLSVVIWFFPNTQQVLDKYEPALNVYKEHVAAFSLPIIWRPTITWAVIISFIAGYAVIKVNSVSEFLYYQF